MRRYMGPTAVIVAALAVLAAVLTAPFGPGPFIVARVSGDEPDATLTRFADAVSNGDLARARSLWIVGPNETPVFRARIERRQVETWQTLAGFVGRPYSVERVQWWSTCCMPSVIAGREGASAARYWVRFDGSLRPYVVTLIASDTQWMLEGAPARGWAVREVHLDGEEPIYLGRSAAQ